MTDTPEPRCAPGLTGGHADGRLVAPAAERNEQPIIDALSPRLSGRAGLVLEIGSGTGQHAAAWAGAFPALDWQPSDPFDSHLDSIRAWVAHAGVDRSPRSMSTSLFSHCCIDAGLIKSMINIIILN